jgi:hypothetical protein
LAFADDRGEPFVQPVPADVGDLGVAFRDLAARLGPVAPAAGQFLLRAAQLGGGLAPVSELLVRVA